MSESEHETAAIENKNESATTNNKLPKHLRQRYWTSFEELRLVELWRLYYNEIETYDSNGPVFRSIAAGMKETGFHLNGQECRRRINSYRNKYAAENQKNKQNTTSDWRLYELVRCTLEPKETKIIDISHEDKIVNQLLNQIPNLPTELQLELQKQNNKLITTNGVGGGGGGAAAAAGQQMAINHSIDDAAEISACKRRNRTRVARTNNGVISLCPTSTYMLKNHLTTTYLAQIRSDNIRLRQQRDAAMKLLLAEQREYDLLEKMLQRWQQQNERLMAKVN